MKAGSITIDGMTIGSIEINLSDEVDVLPDFEGYTPSGRAEDGIGGEGGGGEHQQHGLGHHHGSGHAPSGHSHDHKNKHHFPGHAHHPAPGRHHHPGHDEQSAPSGKSFDGSPGGRPFSQGSAETDAAISRASREHNLDPNFMRGIASIESSMNPSSNAHRPTQYKGLYQIGSDEWRRTGQGGNIYSAQDNAMAGARLFRENNRQFRNHFGRDATETELYMMHQQGLGFYTRGAMTNIHGNPYPGMRGPQTHESFEAGWGREVARRKAGFAHTHPAPVAEEPKKPEPKLTMPEDI